MQIRMIGIELAEHDYRRECERVGVSYDAIQKLIRALNKAGKIADTMGVELFGSGTGTLTVRKHIADSEYPYVLGVVQHGWWSGGDGGEHTDENGLWRGE